MRPSVAHVLLSATLVATTACATVLNDDVRLVSVSSNPSGATVYVDGHQRGTTPVMVPVSNYQEHRVVVQAPGGAPQTCELTTSVGALWVVLDLILIATIVPIVVDAVTGQWASLDQTACFVDLGPGAAAPAGGWGAPPGGGQIPPAPAGPPPAGNGY